ncbi:MAG: hypothetical protein Q7S23_00010 [bacterium]|nr:hypothetical protein [bacterium]
MCTSADDRAESLSIVEAGNRRVARERMLVIVNPHAGLSDRKLTLALLRDQLVVRYNGELTEILERWFPDDRRLLSDFAAAVETVALNTFFTDRRTADRRA